MVAGQHNRTGDQGQVRISCRLGEDQICNLMEVAPCKSGETENTALVASGLAHDICRMGYGEENLEKTKAENWMLPVLH